MGRERRWEQWGEEGEEVRGEEMEEERGGKKGKKWGGGSRSGIFCYDTMKLKDVT